MVAGKGFEELAATIYAELSPGATVMLDERVAGRSGQFRQLDVTVRLEQAGVGLLIVIDTKDYARPADIGEVDEFAGKLEDVGANKGILVCRSGFTEGARQSAARRGIELCNLHDASSRDWALDVRIPILWIDLVPEGRVDIGADLDETDAPIAGWPMRHDGERLSTAAEIFEELWNLGVLPRERGRHIVPFKPDDLELQVRTADGAEAWRQITSLGLAYTVTETPYLGYFTADECRGVLNYRDGSFQPSYLPLESMPTQRDPNWPVVTAEELAVQVAGSMLTTEHWAVLPGALSTVARVGHDFSGAEIQGWQREKLANRMMKWAATRRCTICGSYEVEFGRMAVCDADAIGQRFGVCAAHKTPDEWPPGIPLTIDWMIHHGFGVPLDRFTEDELQSIHVARTTREGLVRTWPHGPIVGYSKPDDGPVSG